MAATKPKSLEMGVLAPSFTIETDDGEVVSLKEFRGRKLVLYFYPKADTPGCTTEALDFSRLKARFAKIDTAVLGVSADPTAKQQRFKKKYDLKIALGSDPSHEVLEAYGAWGEKSLYGRKFVGVIRKTVLIDPKGRIIRIWPKVTVAGHAEDVLATAKAV